MHDLIVPLLKLPHPPQERADLLVRAVFPAEKQDAAAWVRKEFGCRWCSEFEHACTLSPISAYLAIFKQQLVGFACYDAAAKGVFGPIGVVASAQGRGIGTALLFRALTDMRANGYVYAVIGAAGPIDYYQRTVGAKQFDGGSPGFLETLLRLEQ